MVVHCTDHHGYDCMDGRCLMSMTHKQTEAFVKDDANWRLVGSTPYTREYRMDYGTKHFFRLDMITANYIEIWEKGVV